MDPKLKMLGGVPLFAACKPRSLESIAQLADEVDIPAGKVLMREGDTGDAFYFLIDGTVEVQRQGTVVSTLGPGSFFGEVALIDHGPRTATVTSTTPARVLVLAHREFNSLLDQFPDIRTELMSALARRVRNLEPDVAH
jgi:cAMP-binding proteins - catabolite gene activator and regulatory subunit of cAMP-dependent protein kinases